MRLAVLAIVLAVFSTGCSEDPGAPVDPGADASPDAQRGPLPDAARPDAQLAAPDADVPDAQLSRPPDADVPPDAAVLPPPDAAPLPPDAAVPPPPPDASVPPPPDAAASPPDAEVPSAPDAQPPDADLPECRQLWKTEANGSLPAGSTRARIDDGTLFLSSSGSPPGIGCGPGQQRPCLDTKVFQKLLRGDFDVVVEVDGLDEARNEDGVYLFVAAQGNGGSGLVMASIQGFDVAPYALALSEHRPGSFTLRRTSASTTRSTLRIRRSAGLITFSAQADGLPFEHTTDIFTTTDLAVGIGMRGGSVDRPITARVASFTVTGGGSDVVSDDFECDDSVRE